MGEIKSIYELLGRFIPFFASFVWMFLLAVSLTDSKTRYKQQLKWLSLLIFTLFASGCLLPIIEVYFASASAFLGVLMSVVLIGLPMFGYRLVCHLTDAGKTDSFHHIRHYALPIIYVLFLILTEILRCENYCSKQLNLIVVPLFVLFYLLLSLIQIRKYRSFLDAKIRKTTNTKLWFRFVTKVTLVTTLSPVIILFPQNTTLLFVIYMVVMFSFVLVSSQLCYCSVFLNYAQPTPLRTVCTKQPKGSAVVQPQKSNRRIAKVSKNANGRMEMEPLTGKRFEEYMKKHKPYLNANFKMTDMEEALCANRTVISNFVNSTYKMNFNRYINHLRIKEVERLQKLFSSDRCTLTELIHKAGFSTMRNYTRAIDIENDRTQNKEQQL